MIRFPKTKRDWIIATVAALAGFFGGGAIVAWVQHVLKKVM